jgi:hypothetical protein
MAVEILRQSVSIAAGKGWKSGSLDVKANYLQATGFKREIYVRPPWKREMIPTFGNLKTRRMIWRTATSLVSHRL